MHQPHGPQSNSARAIPVTTDEIRAHPVGPCSELRVDFQGDFAATAALRRRLQALQPDSRAATPTAQLGASISGILDPSLPSGNPTHFVQPTNSFPSDLAYPHDDLHSSCPRGARTPTPTPPPSHRHTPAPRPVPPRHGSSSPSTMEPHAPNIMSDSPMSDAMHSLARSSPQRIPVSSSMLRAVVFHPEEAMQALLTAVSALTTTVASNQAHAERQIALLTQLVHQPLPVTASRGPRRPDV